MDDLNVSKIMESMKSQENHDYADLLDYTKLVHAEIVIFLREYVYSGKIYDFITQLHPHFDKSGYLYYEIKLEKGKGKTIRILIKFYLFDCYISKYEYIDNHCGIHEYACNLKMFYSCIKEAYKKVVKAEENLGV